MSVREYIGARYVPIFLGDWDNTQTYEPLSIVLYSGLSYTSRQYVPAGIDISNDDYWACTGNYNAQVEAYRQEVQTYDGRITANENDIADLQSDVKDLEAYMSSRTSQFTIAPILLGCVNYSTENGMYDHPGCICSLGNGIEWLFSSPQPMTDNFGHARPISISNNLDNFSSYNTLELGHANSAAYDKVNDKIYVAPVFDYTGGQQTVANYLLKFTPGSTVTTKITTPVQMMSVSYDPVEDKLYALDYDANIYEVNRDTNLFSAVKTVRIPDEYNQDFAVYDNRWVVSSPSGYLIVGTMDDDEQVIAYLDRYDNSHMFVYAELDGMEFDEDGHLLALAHTDQLGDRPTLIYEIPLFSDVTPLWDYMMKNTRALGIAYSLNINQNNTALRTDGLTAAKGLKSINFVNMLADPTQRSLILNDDYICSDFRLGNDVYNWISLSGHTFQVKGTCTIQTPLIISGLGTFRVKNPIVVAYGIARIGFTGNIDLVVDTQQYMLATFPAGTFASFGIVNSVSPAGLKLYNGADEAIDDNQVYLLGTVLNS